MKTITLITTLFLLNLSAAFATPSPKEVTIDIVPSKYTNLFVFKVDRKFKGAAVEISFANGEVIADLKMEKRQLIIDFRDAKFGAYKIRVIKGNNVQQFQYIRK